MDEELTVEEQAILKGEGTPAPEPAAATPVPAAPADAAPAAAAPAAPEPKAAEPGAPAAAAPEAKPAEPAAPKTVPLPALQEERARRQAAEEKLAKLEGRLDEIARRVNGPEPKAAEPTPEPDIDADPVAALKSVKAKLDEVTAGQAQQEQARQAALAQHSEVQELVRTIQTQEAEFRAANPDYDDAVRHLAQFRHRELETLGHRDPNTRAQIITQEALALGRRAREVGVSAADLAYQLAVARGYQKTQPAAPAPTAAAPAPVAPQPAVPAAPAGAAPTEAARLAAVREGASAGKSLGAAGGGAPPATLDLTQIANMSDAEFERMVSAKDFNRVMRDFYRTQVAV